MKNWLTKMFRKPNPADYEVPPFQIHEGWEPVWKGQHRTEQRDAR